METNKSTSNFSRFLLLWMGQFISAIGGGLTSFGLGVYIFEQTGSAAGMALVTLLGFLPTLVLSVPAGVLADRFVKNGDRIHLSDDMEIEVINTPGHSADEVSYRIGKMVFIGDMVPLRGDIPIFVHLENTLHSLEILENLSGIEKIYPAWDQEYSFEMMIEKIADAREIIQKLEQTVRVVGMEVELPVLVHQVCDRLHTPMWKENPLFARTIDCCRRRE